MEDSKNDNLAYKLHYLNRLLMLQLNDQIKPEGVSQGQLPVLCCLHDLEGQTQAELCTRIQVEQPTMANTLRRMERDGLIRRIPCEQDKRQSRVYLTDRIRPTVEALQQKRDEVIGKMTGRMSVNDISDFHRLLDSALLALETNNEI
ncbi:transcriptional regulator, MarR family [Malonomonas rubra DSM 5091]|uniref:Transcriptional regulator, MarR family n=1 Tax=Malonomonas rubra DSM 5091 TaxID=1122189 RepID=A0A1M6ITI5_MALRU|nr:MarR family transcriptional regulator [Malonomonas rubra]SHJ37669.1 transcriptional regulator, MarR family [Malonomonas rubra DSM 5091]